MAVSARWFGQALLGQYGATAARRVDWVTDTIKVSLHTNAMAPNQDTWDFYDDLTNEISGTGYTAGGATLASKTETYDAPTNELRLDAADAQWTAATFTFRYAVVRKDTGVAATSPVLGYVDMGADESISAGTYTLQWATDGILKIAAA